MGLTREDLVGEMSDQERQDRQAWIDRAMSNDVWAKRTMQDIGILITSHPGNRPYMKACLDSHAELGLWITVAFDSFINPEVSGESFDYNRHMPAKDVMDKIDTFIMPHHQVWGGVLYPYFWLLYWGGAAMRHFRWIYCTNSDFIIEKPEGFWKLFDMVKDGRHHVMTCGHDEPGRYANTAGFFISSIALWNVIQHMRDHFIPFERYEKYTQDIGNAEGRFGRAISDCNLSQLIVKPPADDMLRVPGHGTWYEEMGFRHIHSEHNHAYRNKGIPPHYKYLDSRFMGDEYNVIKKYWDTNDVSVLTDWWAKE